METIASVDTFVLRHTLTDEERFAYSQYRVTEREVLLCRLTTSDGRIGWGESFGPSRVHKTIIDEIYAPIVVRRDPFDSEVIWHDLYNTLRDHGQGGLAVEGISAVDNALWDLKSQIAGVPLYKMLGGRFHDKLMPYATGFYRKEGSNEMAAIREEALRYRDRGFRAMKIKIGFGLDYDVQAVRTVRETVGDEVLLTVDANHGYSPSEAIAVGDALGRFDISWFEEPVIPEDIEGYREVRRKSTIPVSGGECETSFFRFQDMVRRKTFDIVQPDCGVVGGLSAYKKIVAAATSNDVHCYPHIWGSAVALWTGVHAAFSTPSVPARRYPAPMFLEYDQTANGMRDRLSREKPVMKDGWIWPPEEPGLGISIIPEEFHRLRVQ